MPKEQKVTLDEVVEIMGGEVRKAVDKYFDFLQKTVSSYPLGDTELGGLGFMGEQIKSLGEIYTKAATEVLNAPLTTDAIRELTSSIIPPSVRLPRQFNE